MSEKAIASEKITDADRRGVSGAALTQQIGVDRDEINWRKEFTNFTEADEKRLSAVSHLFEDVADDLVTDFYEHLQTHDETVAIISSSSKGVEVLKSDQKKYLIELGSGQYGQQYFDKRARIGKLHDMLDLGPKIYFGAYSIYYRGVMEKFAEDVKNSFDPEDMDEAVDTLVERTLSFQKLINLDQQIAMDTYIESYNEQVRDTLEEQEALMRQVEADVQEPLEQVTAAAQNVTTGTNTVSETVQEQTKSMGEVAGEVSNMSATIEEIAATAKDVSETSTSAETLAKKGSQSADSAITEMEEIEDAVDTVEDEMGELRSQMEGISEFAELINNISDQTNLLALNASIEAANAGDAGRGFAVVANEIKGLAEQSKENASEIGDTILEIQSRSEHTAKSLQQAMEKVNQGISQVEETRERLDRIVESVQVAAQGIEEVSQATDDQASSTEEVASMTDTMVDQLEQIAGEIEDIAEANERQAQEVQTISEQVDKLI